MRVKTLARLNSPKFSMLNFERRDKLLGLFGDPVEESWSFEQIMSLDRASETNFKAVRICMGIPFQL